MHKICNLPFSFKSIHGAKIKFYPKGQIASQIYGGSFEKHQLLAFQRMIKPGMTIIDAGANIGLYSLIGSSLIGDSGKVLAFEPSKETFRRLQSNIKLNGFTNITPFNYALGEKSETLTLRQGVGYGDAERYLLPNNKG